VQFLNNAGMLLVLGGTVWDTSWLLSEGSMFGHLMHTLVGYTAQPTALQLLFYVGTLVVMAALMRVARPAPRERVPA
jgi:High-affinity Fe2+/Pb2+ permease